MKTANVLKAFGFEPDADNKNLYYRRAADGNHDVIKFMPVDDLYNICMADYCCPIKHTRGKRRMSRLLIFSGRVSF